MSGKAGSEDPNVDPQETPDGSKSTGHNPLARPFELVAYLHKIDMKQTPVCSRCDWLISKSALKDGFVTDRLNTSASVVLNGTFTYKNANNVITQNTPLLQSNPFMRLLH